MSAPRFYVPIAEFQPGTEVELPSAEAHHAMRVLRMRQGDEASLFNGFGISANGFITFRKDGASVEISEVFRDGTFQIFPIRLLQSLVSVEKSDWIIEKACETGVSEIIFFPASRSEVKLAGDKLEKRLERWEKTAVSACRQCGRNWLPVIRFVTTFREVLQQKEGLCFVTAPSSGEEPTAVPEDPPEGATFLIGPEGGLSDKEVGEAEKAGFQRLTLGNLVLRTETAGIVLTTWAQTKWGAYRI